MEYLLKSTAILSLFYLFYKVFLQKETFFKSIRVYFLIGFISAIAIPLIVITKYIMVKPLDLSHINFVNASTTSSSPTFDWIQIIIITYIIGVMFFILRFLAQLSSLLWYIYKQPKIKKGKYFMIVTDKNNAPFSFFNYIVYNPKPFKKSELEQIITHEKIHVNQLHSLDTLLSQLTLILHWFNPFVWLYTKEIQKNLEFIADELTQNISQEKKKYQHLLLKTISPNYQMALTNNFYNSLIKKRINMLQKNRSNSTMHFKFALIIPILIAFVFTFNTQVIAQQKANKTIEVQSDYDVEVITKDFTKSQFDILKNKYAKKGIIFKYKKLRYNSKNEITSISLTVKNNKGNQSQLSQNSTEPIKPIKIKINNETGTLSLGNLNSLHESNLFFASNGGSAVHKKIIIKKGDGNHDMVWTSNDSTKVIDLKEGNSFVFYSDEDMHTGSNNEDSTKMKRIKIIKLDGDKGSLYKMKVKSDDSIVVKNNILFINTEASNKTPLIKLDGKEISNEKMEGIDPNNIESMDVLKGETAIKQYGDKGENGVILITTKGNSFIITIDDDKIGASNNKNIIYRSMSNKTPLFILDGKEMKDGKMDDMDPNTIESMNVLKGEVAIKKYGEKGKDGVIEITTKK